MSHRTDNQTAWNGLVPSQPSPSALGVVLKPQNSNLICRSAWHPARVKWMEIGNGYRSICFWLNLVRIHRLCGSQSELEFFYYFYTILLWSHESYEFSSIYYFIDADQLPVVWHFKGKIPKNKNRTRPHQLAAAAAPIILFAFNSNHVHKIITVHFLADNTIQSCDFTAIRRRPRIRSGKHVWKTLFAICVSMWNFTTTFHMIFHFSF